MLLRFGCENFRSINDYQEVFITASSSKKDDSENLFNPDGIRESVLPIVSLYGANGSGKTNIISALRFTISAIKNSAKRDFSDIAIPKFKLDKSCQDGDSTFDLDFILNGVHYQYGFTLRDNKVASEWLFSFSYKTRMSRTVLFYRDIENEDVFYFGKTFKGKNKPISDITNDHSLFLSIAAKSNHELATTIVDYFVSNYSFRFSSDRSEDFLGQKIKKCNLEPEISKFLSLIDIGASELKVEEVDIDEKTKEIRGSFEKAILNIFNKEGESFEFPSSETEHKINIYRKDSNENKVKFSFDDESLGTRSLISLLASVFWILKNGGVFIVDELESSLHTLLSLKVVELFNNKKTNPNGAQLIFTTHETQLLNFNGVRKDEVWLTEKCTDGSTKLAPLSDYVTGRTTNLRNGYLDGRFGAVPFLSLINDFILFKEESDDEVEEY